MFGVSREAWLTIWFGIAGLVCRFIFRTALQTVLRLLRMRNDLLLSIGGCVRRQHNVFRRLSERIGQYA